MAMELETEIAILKNDVNRMTSLFEKLDTAIEKMGEVSNSIARMLAVHEEKLSHQEQTDQELYSLVEKRKQELQLDVKELHSRITTVQRELSDDINETENKIMNALTAGLSDIKSCITAEHKVIADRSDDMERRLNDLEKWRWLIIGGSLVAGIFAQRIIGFIIK
jgi:sugar-specific transcriptional regulator TrmB